MVVPRGMLDRMADRHTHPPVAYRPPADLRVWLTAYAAESGKPVNAVLTEALALFRKRTETAKRRAG